MPAVDLLDLKRALLRMRGRVITERCLLYSMDEPARVEFEVRVRSEYFDSCRHNARLRAPRCIGIRSRTGGMPTFGANGWSWGDSGRGHGRVVGDHAPRAIRWGWLRRPAPGDQVSQDRSTHPGAGTGA